MDNAELVAATLSGDRHARAAVYDRYTDRIHDFAHAVLRDRAEASRVVQETFQVAFGRLGQLRDPAQLGPWLYAIAHRAAVKRAGELEGPHTADDITEVVPAVVPRDDRPTFSASEAPTGPLSVTRAPTPSPDAGVGAAAGAAADDSAQFVWQASGSLGPRERALLDLHVRQGYDGRDLADVVGVGLGHLDTMLERLLAQVERAVGALLVARSNRRDCPRLAELLAGWDGVLTPEMRARITSHVDDCETCNSRRRLVTNPLELLAAVPQVPAPARLRFLVLGHTDGVPSGGGRGVGGVAGVAAAGAAVAAAAEGWIFDADGFPYQGGDRQIDPPGTGPVPAVASTGRHRAADTYTRVNPFRRAGAAAPVTETFMLPPPSAPTDRDRRGVLVGALAGLIILLGGILAFAATRGGGGKKVAVTVATTASPATTTATTAAPTTTTRPPAPTTVPPGHFVVGAKGLDFSLTGTTQSLVVGNDGAGPLTYTANAPYAALTIAPNTGTVQPGANTTLTVTLDRNNLPVGPLSTTIAISSGAGTAIVAVTAENDPGPAISGEQATPDAVFCPATAAGRSTKATVTAQVTSAIPLAPTGIRLHWQPPPNTDTKMTLTGPVASGTLGPFTAAPANPAGVEWWLSATDTSGATTSTAHHYLTVQC